MLGLDVRAARYTWTALLVILAAWLVYHIRTTLFVLTLAILFAYLLAPLVSLLDRLLPGSRTHALALALVYVLLVAVVVTGGILLGSSVVDQANQLARTLPGTMVRWQTSFNRLVPDSIKSELVQRTNELIGSLPNAGLQLLSFASNLIYVVIIPVLAFFCLKDGRLVRKHLLNMVDAGPHRQLMNDVLADVHLLLAHYMRALVLLSAGTFAVYSVFFSLMGLPYAILLGVLGGALEFIPLVGPLTSSVVILVVAGASGAHLSVVLIFIVAYRMFQDYVVSPHLMGQGVELHPLLVLFGVFAGAELAGIAGTFLSVPALALARILWLRIYRERAGVREDTGGGGET